MHGRRTRREGARHQREEGRGIRRVGLSLAVGVAVPVAAHAAARSSIRRPPVAIAHGPPGSERNALFAKMACDAHNLRVTNPITGHTSVFSLSMLLLAGQGGR